MTTIDHQQAAIEAIAGEIAPHAYDKELWRCTLADGRSMEQTASDAEDTAEAALAAATPHLRAETVDRLKNFRNDYQHTYAIPGDPYAEGYLTACKAIIDLLEGGGACCEHSKCPGGSICCCQECGAE